MVKLSDIMDTGFLENEIRTGYISCAAHPHDESLKILCYGKVVQIRGHWNEVTKQCRGLIVKLGAGGFTDAEVIARPWRKFFTLQQIGSGWALGDEEEGTTIEGNISQLDFDAPAEVTDKVDGSMGILYRAPDGLPAFSTKGSFASDQAIYYTNLLRSNAAYLTAAERLLAEHDGTTYIFELIGAGNQIVLYYPNDEIVLLGAVDNKTGRYYSTRTVRDIWGANGLKFSEEQPANNLGEAVRLADRQDKEGVVVRMLNDDPNMQMMVKIKQEQYLALQKLVMGYGESAVREAIKSAGESGSVTFAIMDEIAKEGTSTILPEIKKVVEFNDNPMLQNVRDTRRTQFDDAIVPQAVVASKAKAYIKSLPASDFAGDPKEAKKRFVANVKKAADKTGASPNILFNLVDARIAGKNLNAVSAQPVMHEAAKAVKHITPVED